MLARELDEARAQQAATADVLKVISGSAFELDKVLEALTQSAAKLCNADEAIIFLRAGDEYHAHATYGVERGFLQFLKANPRRKGQKSVVPRVIESGAVEHIPDKLLDKDYMFPGAVKFSDTRAMLGVPMLRNGLVDGVFVLSRYEPGPFTDRQIQILQTFADQAVIAIENTRLFEAVRVRTAELDEALQQQTATADVLKVISRSAFDLDTVLTTLIRTAIQLCDATRGVIWLKKGAQLFLAAHVNYSEEWVAAVRDNPITPAADAQTTSGLAAFTGEIVHVEDVPNDPRFGSLAAHKLGDYRAGLAIPLKRDGKVVGTISLSRPEARLFTDRQVALVQTFADQAVIAIGNARLFEEVQARTRDATEALERHTATGAILRVIAGSPTDIQPVLDAVAESAARLCDAYDATIYLLRADWLAVGAHHGPIPIDDAGLPVARDIVTGRSVLDREPVLVHDLTVAGEEFATGRMMARRLGFRTILATPLLHEGEAIGALMIRRMEARPFGDSQIDLLKTFADQAVIAIGNVRLFEEVRARTAEVSEALLQQTATADVLKVISRSAFHLPTVFDTLVQSAVKLCGASYGGIFMRHGDVLQAGATLGVSRAEIGAVMDQLIARDRKTVSGRVLLSGRVEHIPDVLADPEYDPQALVQFPGTRALMGVPLLRQGKVDGVFVLDKPDPGAFTLRQAELVQTFADQAVIAIENVRLFEEVQARTAELGEALQQQTATADVLKVISRSAFDLHSVLQTLIDSACMLCGSHTGGIYMLDGDIYRLAANYGMRPALIAHEARLAHRVGRDSYVGRTALERTVVHVPDVSQDLEYGFPDLPNLGGFKAVLSVPLMREGSPIGVFSMGRPDPGPFTPRTIELVQTFADQAVIAIENVRLFDEVQARTAELSEALRQQTATADVLKAISRSTFDLPAVLDALVASAATLCSATYGGIFLRDRDVLRGRATISERKTDWDLDHPIEIDRRWISGRVALSGRIEHIPDVVEDKEYDLQGLRQITDTRALMGVPLLREGKVEGVFFLGRPDPGAFTTRQSELVQTFADQAVIAIENSRLFGQVQARTKELSRSIDELQTAQGRLIQTEKLASLGQLTAGIAHEIKNPLNFINNFSALSGELIDELREVLADATLAEKVRENVDELTRMLRGNLDKVVQHGKRADSIVKNMLLHSREGSGEHRPVAINAVVEESLNLAYHGARAEKPGFNITLTKTLDPDAGDVDLYPQEITRVLLNLISNGFYATARRGVDANGAAYEPVLAASTKNLGDSVEIRIRDNGTGIPPEVKEKMFNPFFTTKPAGEGTGLGLSLSHDIIVKQHAGTIEVDTEPGSFTEFRIVLPRRAASLGISGDPA